MRKSFTQLFSVLMLICVFGFQASTFAADPAWDGSKSVPVDEAVNVNPADIATQFVVAFDDVPTITAAGGTMAVYKADDSLLKLIPINNSNSDVQIVEKTIVVNHGMATLAQETDYYIVLTAGAVTVGEDAEPVVISEGQWNFTVGDFTAPKLVSKDPLAPVGNGVEATMAVGGEDPEPFYLTLKFNEDVQVGEGTIAIYQENGTVVELIDVANLVPTQDIDIVGGVVTVTVDDEARFMEETGYYVRVAPGAFVDVVDEYSTEDKEAVPNAYAGIENNTTWTFSTRVNSAPSIVATVTEVTGTTATLTVTIDEDGGFYWELREKGDAAPDAIGDYSALVDAEAGKAVEVDLTGLDGSTDYIVYVIAENDKDPVNRTEIPGTKVAFKTLDNAAPIGYYDEDFIVTNDDKKTTGAYMYFNEEVIGGTGTLSVRKVENNALAATVDAASVSSTKVTDKKSDYYNMWKVVFDFGVELESDVEYYIVFPNGFITDLLGNKYADPVDDGDSVPNDDHEWVINSSDFEAPVVTFWTDTKATETTANITGAGNDDNIYVQFDESVSPIDGGWPGGSKDWTYFVSLKKDGIIVESDFEYDSDNNRIEIDPDATLKSNTTYTVILRPGLIGDTSDNENVIEGEMSITVTTGDNDAATYAFKPGENLGETTPLVIEFAKEVFVWDTDEISGALTTDDVEDLLTLEIDGEEVDADDYTVVYDADKFTVTVTPVEGWPTSTCEEETPVQVMLTIEDEDLVDSKEDFFSGDGSMTWAVKDFTSPEVELLSGNVEITDVVTSNATIEFSENVELNVDYPGQDGFLTMFALKAGSADGKNLPFTVSPMDDSDLFTITPDGWTWETGKTYYYGVGEIFADCADNYAPATYGTFTVVGDAVAPTVEALTYTVNGSSATDIEDVTEGVKGKDGNVVVKVKFNINVDDADLTNPVTVVFTGDEMTAPIPITVVSDDIDGDELTLTFSAATLPTDSTQIAITIPAGLVEGNATYNGTDFAQLDDDVVINLISNDGKDPMIVSQVPADGATVAMDLDEGEMSITFDEPVVLGSGNITFTASGETSAEQTVAVSAANVTLSKDGKTAVVAVDALELYNTDYAVKVVKGAFKDEAGNDLGADQTWNYTTDVNTAPEIAAKNGLNPADGSDLVPLTLELQMTFDENVVRNSAGSRKAIYVIELNSDGTTRAHLDPVTFDLVIGDDVLHDHTYVDLTDNVKVDGDLVTITGLDNLEEDKEYFVLIVPGAFKDAVMPASEVLDFAGITTYDDAVGSGWDFKTGDVISAEADLEFSELGLDELVLTTSDIHLVFTKPVVKEGGADITDEEIPTLISLWKNTGEGWEKIEFTGTISDDKKTITIDNSSLVILGEMVGSTEYKVSFEASVLESEGNETPLGSWEKTFMTSDYEAPDAPTVDFDGDERDAIYYAKNSDKVMAHIAELTVTDESSDAVAIYYLWTTDLDATITAANVKDLGVKLKVGADAKDDMTSGGTADLVFEEGMENETEYRLVAVAEDAAGNLSDVEDFTYFTDDVIAPELAGDLPTEFSVDEDLQITFNEDVMPGVDVYARVIDANGVVYMAPLSQLDGDDAAANKITIVITAAGLPLSDDVANYTIEIDAGMIFDVPRMTEDDVYANDPNTFGGLFGDSFGVTTDDETAPSLTKVAPFSDDEYDPKGVSANPVFTLTFDEPVELNDNFVQFVIYEGMDEHDMETSVVKSASAEDDAYEILTVDAIEGEGTSTITITTSRALVSGKNYYLVINDGTFSDLAGNEWNNEGDITNYVMAMDTEPLNVIFRVPQDGDPYYLPSDKELEYVPESLCMVFGVHEGGDQSGYAEDWDGDDIYYEEYFLSADEPNIDVYELKKHVYVKIDGEEVPFEIEVSYSYNHKIWLYVEDLEDYKGKTITYGFVNLYDEAGNLNEGEEVSFVIAMDAVKIPDLTFAPGDNDDDSDTKVTIPVDQVFTVTFNGVIFSYDDDEEDNNLIMSLELLEDLEAFELYNDTKDEYVDVELLTYTEEDGKSVVTLQAKDGLDSETVYYLEVNDNEVIQVGQGYKSMGYYEETYKTVDVDAPMLIADEDGTLDRAYLPKKEGVVGKSETLALVFNEEVVGAGAVEIHRWDGQLVATVDITGAESADDDDDEWVIELGDVEDIMAANAEFVTNEAYYVIVPDTSILDMSDNKFAGISVINEWSFDLRDDATPIPTFVQNEMMGVAVNTTIDITFDREVVSNYGWLAIYEEVDGDAVELIRIEDDVDFEAGTSFSFDISKLAANTKYYVELGEGSFVLDADGKTKQEQVEIGEWWFSTENNDTPEAIEFSPAHEAEFTYTVMPGEDLMIKFNMDVMAGSGNIQLHNLKDVGDNIISSFDVTDDTKVVFTDSTLTIPGDVLGLVQNAKYYVIIPAGAVTNTSSSPEAWEGIVTPLEWSFSTLMDATVPELSSYTPQDTIEGTHPVFEMTFAENVMFGEAGTLTVTEKDSTDPILVLDITAADIVDNVVTIEYDTMVTGGLNLNTTYIVNVDAGVLVNDAGNAWEGISDNTTWVFTTGENFTTGIDDKYESVDFKVYPNPFNDRVRIDNYDKLTRVVITNIAGQRVLDIEYPSYEIRTSGLTTGVYVISMFTEDGMAKSERIVKR